jgi:predicted acylesterase/phospholipase RssA
MSKTALVVSGGGAKGAFAVGVVQYLYNAYRDTGWFNITGGTSTGALIAPMAALTGAEGPAADEALNTLLTMYTTVSTPDILESQNLFEILRRKDCLNETEPLRARIEENLAPAWFNWLKTDEAPYCYVVYTN